MTRDESTLEFTTVLWDRLLDRGDLFVGEDVGGGLTTDDTFKVVRRIGFLLTGEEFKREASLFGDEASVITLAGQVGDGRGG